jgi:flagellar FliJ protein
MAKFEFQLDGVLKHRVNLERGKQRALAEVQAEMTRLQGELMALDRSVKAANEDMRQNHLTGRLDLGFMAAHRRFLVATQQRAQEIIAQMQGVQLRVDEARRHLVAATKDRKVIEKVRERQTARWREDLVRKERAETDEIGMQLGYANLLSEAAGGGEE